MIPTIFSTPFTCLFQGGTYGCASRADTTSPTVLISPGRQKSGKAMLMGMAHRKNSESFRCLPLLAGSLGSAGTEWGRHRRGVSAARGLLPRHRLPSRTHRKPGCYRSALSAAPRATSRASLPRRSFLPRPPRRSRSVAAAPGLIPGEGGKERDARREGAGAPPGRWCHVRLSARHKTKQERF